MDIFGDDIDSFLEAGELNENIRETDIEENEENENGDDNDGEGGGEPKVVEPKKRSARRPQVCCYHFIRASFWVSTTDHPCRCLTRN